MVLLRSLFIFSALAGFHATVKCADDSFVAVQEKNQNGSCPSTDVPDSPEKDLSLPGSPHKLIVDLIQHSASERDRNFFYQFWYDEDMMNDLSEKNSYEEKDLMCGRAYVGNSRSRSDLMGMILYKLKNQKNNTLYIDSICIAENYKRRGYASALIDKVTQKHSPQTIKALVTKPGENFFYSIGFTRDPKNKDLMTKKNKDETTKRRAGQKTKWTQ